MTSTPAALMAILLLTVPALPDCRVSYRIAAQWAAFERGTWRPPLE